MKFKVPVNLINKKKEVGTAVFIILIGNFLGIGMMIAEQRSDHTQYLERNAYGEGAYEEILKVQTGGETQEIQIFVDEQKYTSDEIKAYLSEAERELELWMKRQTDDNGAIAHNLELPERPEENPVRLSWSTDCPDVLRWDGVLGENLSKQGKKVMLICSLTLDGEEAIWRKQIEVYPMKLSS